MRLRVILTMATFFLACFTITLWAEPASLTEASNMGPSPVPDNTTVSGKISYIGDAAFAVDVKSNNQETKTFQFLIDDNTKFQGRLEMGAKATVEYHTDYGKNIAVKVVVVRGASFHSF